MNKKLFLFLLYLGMAATGYAQALLHKVYKPSLKKATVKAYLDDLQRNTGIQLSYSEASVESNKKISLDKKQYTVEEALKAILAGMPVQFSERGHKILIYPVTTGTAPNPPPDITINGFIKDSSTREVLIGAALYIPELGAGAMTNAYGFYSLTVPRGSYKAVVSYIGYEQKHITLTDETNQRQDILMAYNAGLEEVSITEKKELPIDHDHLNTEAIDRYVALLGDNDIMRALQHRPGVQPGTDGTVGLIVRGGDPGQNMSLLDGVPLYYTDHFLGLSSVYNTDALKSVDFYTGAFPSRYGGRLSSIIDVATKDGDMERIGGQAKIGLLNGSLSLEGPVIKNKASVIVTARRSWMDLLWRPFDNSLGIDFYDINAKANYIINNSNRLFLSIYNGRDHLRLSDSTYNSRSRWSNTFIALKENAILGPKVFLHTTATYSVFRYSLDGSVTPPIFDTFSFEPSVYKGVSTVKEKAIRTQLYWYPSPVHHIEFGLRCANAAFDPANVEFIDYSTALRSQPFRSNEVILHLEDEIKTGRWHLRLGLHWANWFNGNYTYPSLQPRIFASYRAGAALQLFGSFSRMAQFLHMLTNSSDGIPTDFWLPSTRLIKPEIATCGNLGFVVRTGKELEYGAELYYKDMRNLISYKNGSSNIFDNMRSWEQQLTQGKGRSYGAEFHVSKQLGPVWASLAYTLSRSERQFAQLNNGEAFPFRFDRRHNLHLDGIWQISKNINMKAGWTYMSGERISIPDQLYPDFDNQLLSGQISFGYIFNYSSVNNYQLPSVHHLDLAVNFVKKKNARHERTFTLGIYNAYGRKNIISTSLYTDEQGNYSLKGYSLARFIPTLSYHLRF